jgi:hypothetical protein
MSMGCLPVCAPKHSEHAAKFIARCLILIMVGTLGNRSVLAQTPLPVELYRSMVVAYAAGGDLDRAMSKVRDWNAAEFEMAISKLIERGDVRDVQAAAVLHLEFAMALVAISPESAVPHTRLGTRLMNAVAGWKQLGQLTPELGQLTPQDLVAFESAWFGVAASVYLSVNAPGLARPFLQRALRRSRHSAVLQTMAGAAAELDLAAPEIDLWGVNVLEPQEQARRRKLLDVERWYRGAILDDPSYAKGPVDVREFLAGRVAGRRSAAG